jgi:hypothetical protein
MTWSWGPSFGQNIRIHSPKSCTNLDQALNTTNCACHYHQNNWGQDALSISPFLVIDDNQNFDL